MFKEAGKKMIDVLEGKEDGKGSVLGGYVESLKLAVEEAQNIKCPVYLGTGALNKLLQTGKELSLKALLTCYLN
jgi:3-hydroxyisobutyrate dehydrogenase